MMGPHDDLPAAIVVPPREHVDGPLEHDTSVRTWSLARIAQVLLWLAVAAPAVYQIVLLVEAVAGRVAYPYDLEWMEGGMLHHAERIRQGFGIYVPPSVEFIPYLYTPLYPTLLVLVSKPFTISYAVGRAMSIASLIGIAGTALVSFASARQRHLGVFVGSVLALGLFAAYYPYVEGWYDLVRADTLFLFMVTAGIAGLPAWARADHGVVGHAKVAAGAALMALAFFCKQTGIFYVALGGAIVVVIAWRRAFAYVLVAGLIGLGGCWLLDHASDGWFWTYVSEIHRAHDFNMDRFYRSFHNILWHFPLPTLVIAATWPLVAVTSWRARGIPTGAQPFVLWSFAFAVSTLVGAVGWGTEFAHFNAYIPALLHGAFAAGAAVPAVLACVRVLGRARHRTEVLATLLAVLAATPIAYTCATQRWQPARFTPTQADVAAGDRLIERLRALPGDVWMPSHPWYLALAGKTPYVHRMGIKDVTTRQSRAIAGLDEALRGHGFSAIVLDNRDLHLELPALRAAYRPGLILPANERPRVYTGAQVTPDAIWIPSVPATPPANAKAVFDFEAKNWKDGGWASKGSAWGTGPVAEIPRSQLLVLGATGARFATSLNDGDPATGRLTSPPFALDGKRLTLRLGGGADRALRAELVVDDAVAREIHLASAPPPGEDRLETVAIELGALRGKQARLVLVDESPTGHLDLDDVWLWQ